MYNIFKKLKAKRAIRKYKPVFEINTVQLKPDSPIVKFYKKHTE